MVGGRRDEGSLVINNSNVFAALETLRKKKKSDKDRGSSKSKGPSKSQAKESEKQVFWAPTPLTVKSWADVDDEDDDDYYATTAPPKSVWGLSESQETEEKQAPVEESESEEDILDEGDEEAEDEHDQEPEVQVQPELVVKKAPEVSSESKETERQLSKKERKKKELAELEALLADFGVSPKTDTAQDESRDVTKDKKDGDANGVGGGEKKEDVTESKVSKKKKRKDKSSKEVKEPEDRPNSSDVTNGPEEIVWNKQAKEDASVNDVKERLKKVASARKKKSNKELDSAARAAATEAAARSARLAAAKKKEKNHYNQQPVR
ncbi:uncharacterized protein LOC130779444 [Actinidia eriantha]|uniref:uncharacterized protein LOC130779444 n=1 Tax=Actinidia eriantha TaxID=165200 RepID=UPI00258AC4F6|nr:uncharacterized protein LOC130779444 [Actinidia eriantha]